jgi:excinuclease ABC subunit B
MTDGMRYAIDETNRRRRIQSDYNEQNHIIPQSIVKPIDMSLVAVAEGDYVTVSLDEEEPEVASMSPEARQQFLAELEERMREAAPQFELE